MLFKTTGMSFKTVNKAYTTLLFSFARIPARKYCKIMWKIVT